MIKSLSREQRDYLLQELGEITAEAELKVRKTLEAEVQEYGEKVLSKHQDILKAIELLKKIGLYKTPYHSVVGEFVNVVESQRWSLGCGRHQGEGPSVKSRLENDISGEIIRLCAGVEQRAKNAYARISQAENESKGKILFLASYEDAKRLLEDMKKDFQNII